MAKLTELLKQDQSIKFLRFQWLDYTSLLRLRILPVDRAIQLFNAGKSISVPNLMLALLQTAMPCPGLFTNGEYLLRPDSDSLRISGLDGYAAVQCDFYELNGDPVPKCPRTLLRSVTTEARCTRGIEFLVGFEIEVVFTKWTVVEGQVSYASSNESGYGHGYSTASALHDKNMMLLVEAIFDRCALASIPIQHFHPEAAPGQFEFVLPALPPVTAVDTLTATRDIICSIAADFSYRATLYPKPYSDKFGTGAHIHISLDPPSLQENFFAGVIKHLRAIIAFTYPNAASYERASDSTLSGSTWVSWGTENRESPLRRIKGSHYEIRCADGLANMYLALSAIIAAGLLGVSRGEPMTMKDCQDDPAKMTPEEREKLGIKEKIPASIEEALGCLREDKEMHDALGRSVVEHYLQLKTVEVEMLKGIEPTRRRNWLMERY
ncbi:hypothetical protein MMC31_006131 [Peltigera leucophlebia]|nr:hypothetical protein [Peltigera leucophlebia]